MSGSHRARPSAQRLLRASLGPLGALAAVGAFIWVLLLLGGSPSGDGTPAVQSPTTSVAAPSSLTPTSAAPKGSPTVTAPATTSAPAAAPTSAAATSTARAPLTVLNNSTVSGLAATAAARFRAGGWQVRAVGNFTGRVAHTTAYYAPGQEAAAQALAAQFPSIQRVRPRFAGLPGSGLTVVVTRDFPH